MVLWEYYAAIIMGMKPLFSFFFHYQQPDGIETNFSGHFTGVQKIF